MYTQQLHAEGRSNEAMTLCCCYLDGLANLLYHNSEKSAFKFVRLLQDHGEQPALGQVSPLALTRWAETARPKLAPTARKLAKALDTEANRIIEPAELSAAIQKYLSKAEAARLGPAT